MLAILMLLGLHGTGCRREVTAPVDPPPVDEPVVPVEPAPTPQGEPLLYTLRVRSLIVRDRDGVVLAKARCTVPEIVNDSGHAGIEAINQQLAESQQAFLNWVEEDAPEVARDDRAVRKQDFSFHLYERWADVQYNDNGIFSVLTDDYLYAGGVHPSNFMRADNFQVESGARLRLAEVWGLTAEATMTQVYSIVAQQIETERETGTFEYYDDYDEYYREFFDPADFAITSDSLTVFYQPYTISPYAAGIPQFVIPFAELPDTAMPILPIADRGWERDVHRAAGELLERNHEVAFGIYFLGWLSMDTPSVIEYREGANLLFPVTDPRFPNLAALTNYLRLTYTSALVDRLLAEERYVDVDGKLHGDMWKDGGMGYNLNWSDFRFAIREMSGDNVRLAVIISGVQPGDYHPTEETLNASMVRRGNSWVLESMVY